MINNIIVVGRMRDKIQTLLSEYSLPQTFRFLGESEVTDADFEWADGMLGFRPSPIFPVEKLEWVHSLAAGVDAFLFERKWVENVLLTRTVCSFGQMIGQYCLSYMLQDLQKHSLFANRQTGKIWKMETPVRLSTQKVVIIGTGEIGYEMAQVFSVFGVSVIGISASGMSKKYFEKVVRMEEAEIVLAEADFIISTLPLTKHTHNLFDKHFFAQLNGAVFMNVGRGGTVDEAALLDALTNKKISQAILDVFQVEPLPESSLLWTHPSVIVTPHISAVTPPKEAVDCFVTTLKNLEQGNPLINQVDVQRGY